MDVDEFKQINDTYGHHVGDHALREMAVALQARLRPYDLCVRYAGDEFIVVLSDCSRETAERKRRELQDRIGEIELEVRRRQDDCASAPAPAPPCIPHDGTTYEALLADADQRMYRDKARGAGTSTSAPPAARPELQVADLFDRTARTTRRAAAADARRIPSGSRGRDRVLGEPVIARRRQAARYRCHNPIRDVRRSKSPMTADASSTAAGGRAEGDRR